MVYCGKPSRGCQNCKTRRIKCDETRPFCRNCKKTNRTCPGFPEEVDLIFRTETPGVRKRSKKTNTSTKTCDNVTKKQRNDEVGTARNGDLPMYPKKRRRGTDSEIPGHDSSFYVNAAYRRAHSLPGSEIHSTQNVSIEQQATQDFFKRFANLSDGKDTSYEFFDIAASMFDRAEQDAPVRLATEAVAVSVLANQQGVTYLVQLAAHLYGKALTAMQYAMQDPTHATSDTTLLTILLFAMYESITTSDSSKAAWTKHIDGAVAIVKARGVEQLRDLESLALFRAVRSQMLANAVQRREPIEDFPAPRGWLSDLRDDQSVSFKLGEISLAIPRLLSDARRLLAGENTLASIDEVHSLLEEAQRLQHGLIYWRSHQSPDWEHPTTSKDTELLDLAGAGQGEPWPPLTHTYGDDHVANVWNNHESNEMLCLSIITKALRWLNPESYLADERHYRAENRVQSLVNDVCHSVPSDMRAKEWQLHGTPEVGAISGAELSDGCSLIWPLYTALTLDSILDAQKYWIKLQLSAIARHYGLTHASTLEPLEDEALSTNYPTMDCLVCPAVLICQNEPHGYIKNMSPELAHAPLQEVRYCQDKPAIEPQELFVEPMSGHSREIAESVMVKGDMLACHTAQPELVSIA